MKALLTTFLMMTIFLCSAQDEDSRDSAKARGYDPTNMFVGGSLSLSIGGYSNSFLIGLNPYLGYTFAKWIDAGALVNYQHYTEKDEYRNKYRSDTYGVGVFTRLYPVRFLFLQAQPEYNFTVLRYMQPNQPGIRTDLKAPSMLVGAGYTSSRSDKNTFTYLSILFDVLKDKNSPYTDSDGDIIPVVRAGINWGLGRGRRH